MDIHMLKFFNIDMKLVILKTLDILMKPVMDVDQVELSLNFIPIFLRLKAKLVFSS